MDSFNKNEYFDSLSNNDLKGVTEFFGDDLSEILKIVPYAKTAYAGYLYVKRKRVTLFLKSLAKIQGELNDQDKEALRKYISSKEGVEILGEYIDSVHQTSSLIANCALALLYADVKANEYDNTFRIAACSNLKGLDDETVNAFLQLTDPVFLSRRTHQSDGPYPIYILEIKDIDGHTEPTEYSSKLEMFMSYIHALTIKGLLMPDYASARYGSDEQTAQPFGVGVTSGKYRNLLLKAKSLLPHPPQI